MNRPSRKPPIEKYTGYQITVKGAIHSSWSDWFSGMEVQTLELADGTCVTFLRGAVADQAGLRGILNRLWDLNTTLIAVEPINPPQEEQISENSKVPWQESLHSRSAKGVEKK